MKLVNKSVTIASLIVLGSTLSTTAMASNPCQSTYQALESLFNTFGDDVISMGCARSEKSDDCKEKYFKGAKRAVDIRDEYNAASDGPGKVGPRRFAVDDKTNTTLLTGKVLAERVLVGAPIVGRNFRFEFKVTGGKSKKTLKVDVCMLDPDTMDLVGTKYFSDYQTLENAKSIARAHSEPPHIERGFGNSTGLIPVMYLHKPAGVKSFQYQVTFQERGIPDVAKDDTGAIKVNKDSKDLKIIEKVLKNISN